MTDPVGDRRDLKRRTKEFALRVIGLVQSLSRDRACDVIGGQLLRAGTGVGSNYRAARRSRSRKEFVARVGVAEEEADESAYWMELLVESGRMPLKRLQPLMQEADELVAIFVSSAKTARKSARL